MPMTPFYFTNKDVAVKETRTAIIRGREGLPDDEYGFIESYCDEEGCDCRRVLITVLSPNTGDTVLATINYGWEEGNFYAGWGASKDNPALDKRPWLDPLNPQTALAPRLLELFEFLLTDTAYVDRFKRHYKLSKAATSKGSHLKLLRATGPKTSRRRKKR